MGKRTASPPSDALDIPVGTEVAQGLLGSLRVARVSRILWQGASISTCRYLMQWGTCLCTLANDNPC
jgi:hypothetical protein